MYVSRPLGSYVVSQGACWLARCSCRLLCSFVPTKVVQARSSLVGSAGGPLSGCLASHPSADPAAPESCREGGFSVVQVSQNPFPYTVPLPCSEDHLCAHCSEHKSIVEEDPVHRRPKHAARVTAQLQGIPPEYKSLRPTVTLCRHPRAGLRLVPERRVLVTCTKAP